MPLDSSCFDPQDTTPAPSLLPREWLDDEPFAGLDPSANVRAWIEALRAGGYGAEALRVVAHLLPRKYALAWGCECLKARLVEDTNAASDENRFGLMLAERWLATPTEAHRLTALEFAERGDFQSAGAWIAAAAGWADGSITAPPFEPVPWPEKLTNEAVAAALLKIAPRASKARVTALNEMIDRALAAFGPVERGA